VLLLSQKQRFDKAKQDKTSKTKQASNWRRFGIWSCV